jgi:hypothetical protein
METMTESPTGTYKLIPDFDAAILARLQDEGAKVGFRPRAKQVRQLVKELQPFDPEITSAEVQTRLRVMHHHKLVTKVVVQPVSHGAGWQRTADGRQFAIDNGALTESGALPNA